MRRGTIHLALSFVVAAAAAQAGQAQECPDAAVPPAPFAAWSSDAAAPLGATDRWPMLAVGQVAEIMLAPSDSLRWERTPERAPPTTTRGAVLAFRVDVAGTYAIALGAAMWVDVVGSDGLHPSTAHGHGPRCTTLRKVVDFSLQPGLYHLQLSGAEVDRARVLVARR